MTNRTTSETVDLYLAAIEAGDMNSCTVWADDVVLDATVPGWRFVCRGPAAVRDEYGRWFADPGRLEELRRLPTTGGEVVEYLLNWSEGGIPHAAHHVHILEVADGRITRDHVMCGGRWPAALLAEMEAASELQEPSPTA